VEKKEGATNALRWTAPHAVLRVAIAQNGHQILIRAVLRSAKREIANRSGIRRVFPEC
jgi:hypothetical protein